jgi:hypothetical protein
MKRIIGILLVTIFIFAGCAKVEEKKSPGVGSATKLEITGAEYRVQWEEEYKYNTPILIENISDWKKFLKDHPEQSANEDNLKQKFDEAFFKDSVVYAYVKSEGSGSNKLNVDRAELQGDKLKLFMKRTAPQIGTADMAARVCLFGIKRDKIKGVKTVEGIVQE